jgi:hypothetical protein
MEIKLHIVESNTPNNTALLLIPGRVLSEQEIEELSAPLSASFKVLTLRNDLPASMEVFDFADSLEAELKKLRVKTCTVLGISSGSSLAQAISIRYPKRIRRVALVDAIPRVAPSSLMKLIDRIEGILPLGLPFRSLSNDFDSRPMLHRIHCPCLIAVSPSANNYTREQSNMLGQRIPNSWSHELSQEVITDKDGKLLLSAEFEKLLLEFLLVPAKKPQKNLARENLARA